MSLPGVRSLTAPGTGRPLLLCLLAVAVAGVVPALPGLHHPPQAVNPDEWHFVPIAMRAAGNPALNPRYFLNPSGPVYAYLGWLGARYVAGRVGGSWDSVADFVVDYLSNPTPFFVFCRILSLLAGVAAGALLAWGIARSFSLLAGLLAGLALVLSPLAQGRSFVAIDEPMLLLACSAALLALLGAVDRLSYRRFLWSSALFGVAVGTKYNAGAIVVLWAAAGLTLALRARVSVVRLAFAALLVPTAFLVTTPHAVLDWGEFSFGVSYNREMLGAGGHFFAGLAAYSRAYIQGFLPPWLVVPSVLGLAIAWRSGTGRSRVLFLQTVALSAALALYLSRGRLVTPRYALPALPWLAASAGVALAEGFQALRHRWRGFRLGLLAAAFAALAAAVPPALANSRAARDLTGRWTLTEEVSRRCLPGDRIISDWYGPLVAQTAEIDRWHPGGALAAGAPFHLRTHTLFSYVTRGLNPLPEDGSSPDLENLRRNGYRYAILRAGTPDLARSGTAHPDLLRFVDELERLSWTLTIHHQNGAPAYLIYRLDHRPPPAGGGALRPPSDR